MIPALTKNFRKIHFHSYYSQIFTKISLLQLAILARDLDLLGQAAQRLKFSV